MMVVIVFINVILGKLNCVLILICFLYKNIFYVLFFFNIS